jgi:hypothetical protein
MENYTTFHKVINLLKSVQQASPRMNSFGYGDIVYFTETTSGTTTQYPLMFVTPIAMSYDESTTTYQMSVIFADIVNTDMSNEIDVVSDMELEARNLLSQIKRGSLINQIDTDLPATSSPFFERFNDHVGGVVLDVSLVVFEDINACDPYPACVSVTNQYLTTTVQGSNNARFTLWSNSGHTVSANAICDVDLTYSITGSSGTTVTNLTTTMVTNDHQHQVNVSSFLPGEILSSVHCTKIQPLCGCYNIYY